MQETACSLPGLIPGLGRYPGGGNGNPFQHFCLENPMDKGDLQTIVHGVTRFRHDLVTKPQPENIKTSLKRLKNDSNVNVQGI